MARDPYRYFRVEAQELLEGLSQGMLALQGGPDRELVRRMLRQAHTFKGAARVVRELGIGDHAHAVEDLLAPHRDAGGPLTPEDVDQALSLLDQIRTRLGSLSEVVPVAVVDAPVKPPPDEATRSVRVGIDELDGVLEGILEAGTAAAGLRHSEALLAEARAQVPAGSDAARTLDRLRLDLVRRGADVARELAELRERTSNLRLVPATALVHDLERAVRDAARSVGRSAVLTVTGADTRIDAHVLAGLRSALLHAVRNAVAHGIEDPDGRVRAGKPPDGQITVSIERRGHRVRVTCRDDGRGLDLDRIREIAVARGSLVPGASDGEVARLLLHGGLSTSSRVSAVSGRGVGLDVVREVAERLNGEVSLTTHRGTTLTLVLPVSLASMPAVSVVDRGRSALLPLDAVRQVVRVRPDELSWVGDGERIQVDGELLPYLPLSRALGGADGAARSAVVIEANGVRAALGVERVEGVSTVVVRPLPAGVEAAPVVGGVVLDEDGIPRLMLLPSALIDASLRASSRPPAPAPRAALPVLIVDDSLTTRMLEQSILESAGYIVDLAVSGEDGLRKARERRYALFLVDVEMPGIDGFEFVARTRSDPALSHVPAILVTSRSAAEDRQRGKDVGARGYVVKSEFDQQALLRSIRQLVG